MSITSFIFIDRDAATGCVLKEGAVENFAKFTGNTCACIFVKKGTLAQVLCSEFCKSFKNVYFEEHL